MADIKRKKIVSLVNTLKKTLVHAKTIYYNIFNILVKNNKDLYTDNTHGVFINLLKIDDDVLEKAIDYIESIRLMDERNNEIEEYRATILKTKMKTPITTKSRPKVIVLEEDLESEGDGSSIPEDSIESLKPKKMVFKGVYLRINQKITNRKKKTKEDDIDEDSLIESYDEEEEDEPKPSTFRPIYDLNFVI